MKRIPFLGLCLVLASCAAPSIGGNDPDCFTQDNLIDLRVLETLPAPTEAKVARAEEVALSHAHPMNDRIGEVRFVRVTGDSPSLAEGRAVFLVALPDQRGPHAPVSGGGMLWDGPELVVVDCQIVVTDEDGRFLFMQELQRPAK
jgi:hypothetical protein